MKNILYLIIAGAVLLFGIQVVLAIPSVNLLGNYAVVGNNATTTANANFTASGTIAFETLKSSGDPCLTIGSTGLLATSTCGGSGANTALSNLAAVAINTALISDTDSTDNLGSSSIFWANVFTDKIQFPVSSSATSAPFLETSGQTLILDLNRTDDSNSRTFLIKNTGSGDPILSIQEGNGVNSLNLKHTSTNGFISTTFGNIQFGNTISSDTDSTDDLGSTAIAWANLYVDTIKSITGNALNLTPIAGSNLNINLSTTGDLAVNTNHLYVDTSAGNIGIGITSPTAALNIKAGTTAAGTAPLKLNSGTLLTTAEAGAIEFLSDAFYGTITTGAARKTFAFLESPSFTTPALGTPSSGVMTNVTGIPVGALANGTDGNLITWNSSGVADVVATGNSGQVLTSNGAGAAPTFQAAAGGGTAYNTIEFAINPAGAATATSSPAGSNKKIGTNWTFHTLDYDGTTSENAFWTHKFPGFTALNTCSYEGTAMASATTTGSVSVMAISYKDIGTAAAWTSSASTTASTTLTFNTALEDLVNFSLAVSTSSISSADTLLVNIHRRPTESDDTNTSDARYVNGKIICTYR